MLTVLTQTPAFVSGEWTEGFYCHPDDAARPFVGRFLSCSGAGKSCAGWSSKTVSWAPHNRSVVGSSLGLLAARRATATCWFAKQSTSRKSRPQTIGPDVGAAPIGA
jgi:hypothetical protein